MILNFNDVEWEVLDTPIAERFAKFLVANVHETNEFFFMGETLREIKSEIEKIAYMAGWPADSDMNKLHEMFADHPDHPDASRLNDLIHYHELQLFCKKQIHYNHLGFLLGGDIVYGVMKTTLMQKLMYGKKTTNISPWRESLDICM